MDLFMKKCTVLLFTPLLLALGACEVTKSETPLSPTLAGPIPGVEISAPKPLEPAAGAVIPGDRQPITLLLENSYSTGPRPLSYLFEIATDAGFSNKVFTREGVAPGDGGRTSLRLSDTLGTGRGYYWRAKAQDGANTGPFSPPVAFTLFIPISFDKPTLDDPINNEKVNELIPEFRINNAPRSGSPSGVAYVLEVAANSAFTQKIAVWQFAERPNQTKFSAPAGLPPGMQLFWRAHAFAGSVIGPWSDTGVFRTPDVEVVVVPGSPPSGVPPKTGPFRDSDHHLSAYALYIIDALYARNKRLAEGDDDDRRALTIKMAEQFVYSFGPQWGTKRADSGRPTSKDAIAYKSGSTFLGYDWQNGSTRAPVSDPTPMDLTGQVFEPRPARNHLGL